ncbi:hypothetical protein [Rhizobacter sp. Root404]|uniref:hypothetical protein n=1 Tax=Rhizobacter sp. Root404 TaxID=1736528 RepID=UPI0012F88EE3|nr:hypothetical protein [Rhizobacter sp. Root404]
MRQDRVLTINDYFDGPRLGIAEVAGIPHIYEAEFDHSSEDYGDTYFVSPVDADLLSLVLEDWEIFSRWNAARLLGDVDVDTHPALPNDRLRHEEVRVAVGNRLRTEPSNRRYFKARFQHAQRIGDWIGTTVAWLPLQMSDSKLQADALFARSTCNLSMTPSLLFDADSRDNQQDSNHHKCNPGAGRP